MMTDSAAVLLAGDRSRRGGRDLAIVEFEGVPLWRRQRDVLRATGAGEIYLSARLDQAWTSRVEGFSAVVHDAMPGCGPLVGVVSALERTSLPWVLALSVDMPAMTADWFAQLSRSRSPGVGVVGRRDGCFEPLAAIYPREFRFLGWEAMVRQEFSFDRVLTDAVAQGLMRVREISAGEAPLLVRGSEWAGPGSAPQA